MLEYQVSNRYFCVGFGGERDLALIDCHDLIAFISISSMENGWVGKRAKK